VNHFFARESHHHGTALWFTQGDVFKKWKTNGSLLWIHGIRTRVSFVYSGIPHNLLRGRCIGQEYSLVCVAILLVYCVLTLSTSSTIIQDINRICETGAATCAYFYFDFRDIAKQDVRGLLSSLVDQLSSQSNDFSAVLSELYSSYDRGSRQPSNEALMECLKKMLKLPGQGPVYLIIDALDECPKSGYPTARGQVLVIMQELINLKLPHVHLCITSRLESDILEILEPLAIHNVPLPEKAGQNQDVADSTMSLVHSEPRTQDEAKELAIRTLTGNVGKM